MIEAYELAARVWLFKGDESGRNFCVVLRGPDALLVDPRLPSAIEKFLGDMDAVALALAYTQHDPGDGDVKAWAGLPLLLPSMFQEPTLLGLMQDWQAVPFSSGTRPRMALFQGKERVLLCGDLLPEPSAGVPVLAGGSEAYLADLQLVESLDPRLAVPWRGDPATGKRAVKARIENDRNYIHSLLRHVATSSGAGVPLDRLVQVASSLYEDFPYLDAHLDNMRVVWQELREG